MGTWYSWKCFNEKCGYDESYFEGDGFVSFVKLTKAFDKITSGKFNHHKKCKEIYDLVNNNKQGIRPDSFFLCRNDLYVCDACRRAFTLRTPFIRSFQENRNATSCYDMFEYQYFHVFGEPSCPYCGGAVRHIRYSCDDIEGLICPKCGSPAIVYIRGDWD